jgi:hypothetical protein
MQSNILKTISALSKCVYLLLKSIAYDLIKTEITCFLTQISVSVEKGGNSSVSACVKGEGEGRRGGGK